MSDHAFYRLSIPNSLQSVSNALNDAHTSWHEACEAYHHPSDFRRYLEATIQGLRNVTFRLQAVKSAYDDFDSWYSVWQEFFRTDVEMRWLNDARISVVKTGDLETASTALVRGYWSYLEPPSALIQLPATVATSEVVNRARKGIPKLPLPHATIEVARRWEVPDFPDDELLGILARCWSKLAALTACAVEMLEKGDTTAHSPHNWLDTMNIPECMNLDPSLTFMLVAADSGKTVEYVADPVVRDDAFTKQAATRYKTRRIDLSDDLEAIGAQIHEQARNVFKRDGHHYPFLHLRRPNGSWELLSPMAEDKRSKFVIWHRIGEYVEGVGHDAFVFTTEVWQAPMSAVSSPYSSLEDVEGRTEFLTTFAKSADGTSQTWYSEIVRMLRMAFVKKTNTLDAPAEDGFSFPIQRAWQKMSG